MAEDQARQREQRTVFGEVAELYDKARAAYPDALIDDVVAFARAAATPPPALPDTALEIGAGTGKATVAVAARGFDVTAREPDEAMAAVARRNCERFPGVRIEVTTFEDWPLDANPFDLVFSAQAWHWVPRNVRGVKAADALRPGGALALFWHRTEWRGEQLRDDLDALYRRVAPELHAQDPGFPGLAPPRADQFFVDEIEESGGFDDVRAQTYPWRATFTPDTFVELLLTQSNHRLLPDGERARLFDAIRQLIAAHGGVVDVPHATLLVLARRRA